MRDNKAVKEKEKEIALKKLREELTEEIALQLREEPIPATDVPVSEPVRTGDITDEAEAKQIVEAIIFTASRPVTVQEIKRALPHFTASKLEGMIRELQSEYEAQGKSYRIQEIAGGFECATEAKFAPWILRLELQRKAKQATQSALETLAILAYKQPVTRAEIEDLRGVDVSGVLGTLLERNLIKIVGRKEVPGRPFMYGTTDKFLEHFGLKSIKDLPDISEIKSLVEGSVKKDELLRTQKMVSNEENAAEASSEPVAPEEVSGEATEENNVPE